jgi:hypothetical protein
MQTELIRQIDEDNPAHNTEEENEKMKMVSTIEVQVYRMRQMDPVKPKRSKVKARIKEAPEKLLKGQAISYSIEYAYFPLP